MNELELIKVDSEKQTVSARELYEAVGSTERFSAWFERQLQFGFVEGEDFTSVKSFTVVNNGAERELQDYELTLDTAKQICMVQKNEKAKEIRQYLIKIEKAWNSPEQIMARALKVADETINKLKIEMKQMKPKAEYFDALVERDLLVNFRDSAKELGIKEKDFVNWLIKHNYVYRDQRGKLKPYAEYVGKYFELKEYSSSATNHTGVQTLIKPEGRAAFRRLIPREFLGVETTNE